MKRKSIILTGILFLLLLFLPTKVFAKEELKKVEVSNFDTELIGIITFYDDYTLEYDFKYLLKDIKITVCAKGTCDNTSAQIVDSQLHVGENNPQYNLSEYLIEKPQEYTIKAKGSFKSSNEGSYVVKTLTYVLVIEDEKNEDKDGGFFNNPEFRASFDKAVIVINKFVIPGIYIALGIIILVKGILLCIDIVKYSDKPNVRKEKLRAFLYLIAVILSIGLLNTCFGLITGLF